jgi:hypothetical protein
VGFLCNCIYPQAALAYPADSSVVRVAGCHRAHLTVNLQALIGQGQIQSL